MPRLVVIAGPACSGKMPLCRKLMSEDAALLPVHRDYLRTALETEGKADEAVLTQIMGDAARRLLLAGHSVIAVAWNLEPMDRAMWTDVAFGAGVPMEWLGVRRPEIAALIPPMEAAA